MAPRPQDITPRGALPRPSARRTSPAESEPLGLLALMLYAEAVATLAEARTEPISRSPGRTSRCGTLPRMIHEAEAILHHVPHAASSGATDRGPLSSPPTSRDVAEAITTGWPSSSSTTRSPPSPTTGRRHQPCGSPSPRPKVHTPHSMPCRGSPRILVSISTSRSLSCARSCSPNRRLQQVRATILPSDSNARRSRGSQLPQQRLAALASPE